MEIIAHVGSGKGRGKTVLDTVEAYLSANSVPYNVHVTQKPGDAESLASELSNGGADTVVAIGGDGTFHEALNGINFENTRLGLIPAGRGNDFATGTKSAPLDPEKAIASIVRGEHADLDYIKVASRRCLNVAGTGLDVEVLKKTANSHNKLTYVASLFRCLLKFKPYDVDVTVGDETTHYKCIMAGVCNGTQFGGGIRLAPTANAGDGLLDLIVMEKPKRVPTIFVMPKFVKGKHMNKPYTHHLLCEKIHIATGAPVELDGEIYEGLDFEAEVVKGGFKTFAPVL